MRPALGSESLLGAALAGRAARPDASVRREVDAGFAGLLDGARQQQGGRVYDGSAFDVPEPKPVPDASRAGSAAELDRRLVEQRRQQALTDARRESDSPEPGRGAAARTAESKPATPTAKTRAPEAPREPGRTPKDAAVEDDVAPERAAAATEGEAHGAVGTRAESELAIATTTTTQDWMARWSSGSGGAAQAASTEGGMATSANALQPFGRAARDATGDPAAAQAAGAQAAVPDTSASRAGAVTTSSEEARADAGVPTPIAPARLDAPMPPPSAAVSATTASAEPAAATANVPVPLDAPDFPQALGWQLATLVRDGVHEAQLALNPVEMGPVQVQILLDGGQAQIDFTAAQARTRDVLEAGWPALAAAMHSAGFTLGGGGVFEQRTPQREAQGDAGADRSRSAETSDTPTAAGPSSAARARPRGLLDLYA